MKKIIDNIFFHLQKERYVIARLPQNFPQKINQGSDIDLFCDNIKKISKKISPAINYFLTHIKNSNVNILHISNSHIQIDFNINKRFLFKLDIFDKIEDVKNYDISKKFFINIFNNRKTLLIKKNSKIIKFYVPKSEDETFIRYLEFIKSGKKKKQHEKFFYRYINDKKLKKSFDHYISKKKLDFEILIDIFKKYKSQINYYKYKFDKHSIKELMNLMIKKFNN